MLFRGHARMRVTAECCIRGDLTPRRRASYLSRYKFLH